MARLQILELPAVAGDERPPYILVIDQATKRFVTEVTAVSQGIAEAAGARTVFVFEETVEIPANDVRAAASGPGAGRHCGEHGGPCFPERGATCVAHGDEECLYCHRNPADCANSGNCSRWARTGMHWDSCANRVRGPLAAQAPNDHQTPELIYAHERTRLDLCSALLVSGDTTWRKLIEHVADRQRNLAGVLRERDVPDPKLVALVRETLGIDNVGPAGIPYDEALHNACRQLEKSEAARRHLNRERDTLNTRLQQVQQTQLVPDAMDAGLEHPNSWLHGYRAGVLAAKAAARPRNEPTVKP